MGGSARGASQLLVHHNCPTEYSFTYILGLSSLGLPDALSIGIAAHAAMEHYQKSKMGILLPPVRDFVEEQVIDFAHVDIALALLATYKRQYEEEDARDWEVVLAEEEIPITLGELDPGGPFPELDNEIVTVKPDKLERHRRTGRLKLSDYKTEFVPYNVEGFPIWDSSDPYSAGLQGMFYLHVLRLKFPKDEFGPFVIERFRKVKPYAIKREPLRFSPCAYRGVPRNVRYYVKAQMDTHAMLLAGVQPAQNFGACTKRHDPHGLRKFSDCAFRSVCHATSRKAQATILNSRFSSVGNQLMSGVILGAGANSGASSQAEKEQEIPQEESLEIGSPEGSPDDDEITFE